MLLCFIFEKNKSFLEYKQQEVFGLVECARNQWFATRHLDE